MLLWAIGRRAAGRWGVSVCLGAGRIVEISEGMLHRLRNSLWAGWAVATSCFPGCYDAGLSALLVSAEACQGQSPGAAGPQVALWHRVASQLFLRCFGRAKFKKGRGEGGGIGDLGLRIWDWGRGPCGGLPSAGAGGG